VYSFQFLRNCSVKSVCKISSIFFIYFLMALKGVSCNPPNKCISADINLLSSVCIVQHSLQ
jgi:hypothetical protein